MAWQVKKRGPGTGYYYHSVRIGDKVKNVYLGRGVAGHEAAAAVEARRREAAEILRAARERTDEADRLAAELQEWADGLLTAWLVLSGFHKHKRQWRARRG